MKYYLYRHIRLDKNEPFYIGYGEKKNENFIEFKDEYNRAFSKVSRSDYWKRIIKKTEYSIEIIFETDDLKLIKEKEKEFISLYGRSNLKNGILCNLTDGGDGTHGWKPNNVNKDNHQKRIEERKRLGIKRRGKKVYKYDSISGKFIKEFVSMMEAANEMNLAKSVINKVAQNGNNNHFCKGYLWFDKYQGESVEPYLGNIRYRGYKLYMIDKVSNKEITEFKNATEAFNYLEKKKANGHISRAITKNTTYCGYKWRRECQE